MLSIIVAIAENYAIGKNNDLLWHISEDLKRFKDIWILVGQKLKLRNFTESSVIQLSAYFFAPRKGVKYEQIRIYHNNCHRHFDDWLYCDHYS